MPTSKTGAHRESGTDELDYYPTPPWATRALIHEVILAYPQHFPIPTNALSLRPNALPLLLEPCCGEGHMWEALHEQWADDFEFYSSDIQDLGFARQDAVADFRQHRNLNDIGSWVITNPPFNHMHEFLMHFLPRIQGLHGSSMVAVFARLGLLESVKRYHLFQQYPPALAAPFAERVVLRKGRLTKKGSGNVPYAWYIWTNNPQPLPSWPGAFPTMQIRPCRAEYERDSDYD